MICSEVIVVALVYVLSRYNSLFVPGVLEIFNFKKKIMLEKSIFAITNYFTTFSRQKIYSMERKNGFCNRPVPVMDNYADISLPQITHLEGKYP